MCLMAVVCVNNPNRVYVHRCQQVMYIHVYKCALIQYMPYIHTHSCKYWQTTPNELQQVMLSTHNSTPTHPHYHFLSTSTSALTWDCKRVPICCMESKQDGTSTQQAQQQLLSVHTHTHTYILHACVRVCVRTYIRMCTHSAIKHTHMLKHTVNMHTQTLMHTSVHTVIRTYINTNVLMLTIIT